MGDRLDVLQQMEADGPIELDKCPQPDCKRNYLVYPFDWEEVDSTHWDVTCRCPNCGWEGGGVYDDETVERFDEALDEGTEAVVKDLLKLMCANMEEDVENLITALRAGQIFPGDISRTWP